MKKTIMKKIINAMLVATTFLTTSNAFSSTPLWTFMPLTATTITISAAGSETIQYLVTNQSRKVHTLVVTPMPGITQVTTAGNCSNPFVLGYQQSCTLTLQVTGSELAGNVIGGPIVCEQGNRLQCYQPSAANVLNITVSTESPSTLTSISPITGSGSGGTGFILTGTGLTGATGITFDGLAATSVNVVNSTTVTGVTPAHAPGVVDVTIDTPAGGATLATGYTYVTSAVGQSAFGGTIACLNGGLNDLIAATADNSTSIEWGGFGGAATNATSITDGATNTTAIVTAFGTNGGLPYAAKLCNDFEVDSQGNTPCQAGNTCYNDWFLPAGNNLTVTGQLNCLYTNRVAIGGFTSDFYWGSTEFAGFPQFFAWSQNFSNGALAANNKDFNQRVRCVRAFTP